MSGHRTAPAQRPLRLRRNYRLYQKIANAIRATVIIHRMMSLLRLFSSGIEWQYTTYEIPVQVSIELRGGLRFVRRDRLRLVSFSNFAYGIAWRALATSFADLETVPADLTVHGEYFSAFADFVQLASSLICAKSCTIPVCLLVTPTIHKALNWCRGCFYCTGVRRRPL